MYQLSLIPGVDGTCARAHLEHGVWMYQALSFSIFFFLAHVVFESLAESLNEMHT